MYIKPGEKLAPEKLCY